MKVTTEITVERDGAELELEVTGEVSAYVPARTWGPPESCYPAEGGEVEILSLTCDGKPWNGELTASEQDDAEQRLRDGVEGACDDEDPPEPDYDMDDGGEPHGSYAGDEW